MAASLGGVHRASSPRRWRNCRGDIRHLFNSARNCSSCALCGRFPRGYVSSFMPGVGL